MMVSDMILEIQDHGFQDLSTTRLMSFLNDTYRDVNARAPWPYLEATSSTSNTGFGHTTADLTYSTTTGAITAPADIGKVLKLVDNATGIRLEPRRLDDFTQNNASRQGLTGIATQYYFIGDTLYVYPIPASGQQYTLRYLRIPSDLTSTPDSTWVGPARHSRVLVLGALAKCYLLEDDASNWQIMTGEYENRIGNMREDLFMHQYDRPDFIQDVDNYDWVDWLQDGGY